MPSWYNARGRLDRSACIEIRVSEVRRLAGSAGPKPRIWPDMRKGRLPVLPLPYERPARTADGRVATGRFTVTAEQLHGLQAHRLPRQLAGDRRTIRANAMRPPRVRAEDIGRIRRPHNAPPDAARWDVGLNLNPNRGAGRTKIIGLTADWSQPLRIEKWQYPHRIRPAYFLICPGWSFARRLAALSRSRSGGACTDASGALPLDWLDPELPPSRDPRFPPLSVCGRGRKDPQRVRCPQRCYKLLLVQCTPAEAGDADAALARAIGRTPSAVAMKACNFASLDPVQQARGISALGNVSQSDRELWERFLAAPDEVADEAESLAEAHHVPANRAETRDGLASGPSEVHRLVRTRRIQSFFRASVMAAYGGRCAVTNIGVSALLNASHIIPWSKDERRRGDPRNGLCLNVLYDRAFDRGLITFDNDCRMVISRQLKEEKHSPEFQRVAFLEMEGCRLRMPERFSPDEDALSYHRVHIFANDVA